MTVYVDTARNPFGRMIMCHMISDDISELLDMADKIGLARRHFQPWSHPHFDVSLGYRKKALSFGAVEVDRRGLVDAMKAYRLRLKSDEQERAVLAEAAAASDLGRRKKLATEKSAHR